MEAFWEENRLCFKFPSTDKPRVPVSIGFGGDWICEFLKIPMDKYHSDYVVQQNARLRAGEITKREVGLGIGPGIDFGVVMDASIYGGKIIYDESSPPWIAPVVLEPKDVYKLADKMDKCDNLLELGLLPKFFRWRERLEQDFGIKPHQEGGGIKGPATIAGQLCGFSNFLLWLYTNPDEMKFLAELIVRTSIRYLRQLREVTGGFFHGLGLASDLSGLMSPQHYEEFCFPADKTLFDTLAPPGSHRGYHADSDMRKHLKYMNALNLTWVNFGPTLSAPQIRREIPHATIQGHIPPKLLWQGSPEDVIECAKRDLRAADDGNLILSTAGSLAPGTPFENIKALCWAAHYYGRYKNGVIKILEEEGELHNA